MRRQTRLGNRLSNLALGPCLTIVAPLAKVAVDDPPSRRGGVAEWLKAHAWKVCIGETLSRVRIPLPPPYSSSRPFTRVLFSGALPLKTTNISSGLFASIRPNPAPRLGKGLGKKLDAAQACTGSVQSALKWRCVSRKLRALAAHPLHSENKTQLREPVETMAQPHVCPRANHRSSDFPPLYEKTKAERD